MDQGHDATTGSASCCPTVSTACTGETLCPACREGLEWSKDTTASASTVLDNYGKHIGELDHLIQPVALRVQVRVDSLSVCHFALLATAQAELLA